MSIPYIKSFLMFITILVGSLFAYQIDLTYMRGGDIVIKNPEVAKLYFDELNGQERNYVFNLATDTDIKITILKPETNDTGQVYAAKISSLDGNQVTNLFNLDAPASSWSQEYDSFMREYFVRGPEIVKTLSQGRYEISIYSYFPQDSDNLQGTNKGKYVLRIGQESVQSIASVLQMYWQIPLLKIAFFKTSVVQFLFTPVGISLAVVFGILIILIVIFSTIISSIQSAARQDKAKTILLTSSGMEMKDEIVKLLQKPTYDINIAFINTASKEEENQEYVQRDLEIMKEMRFNVAEIDIEGKKEFEVAKLLELKDIIYVEGGNTFKLLKAMRECNFEKIIRKLLGQGKVYMGVSAGSMVAGKTIKTAMWKTPDKNKIGLKNLKGLNLVPFDVFVHYQPEYDEIIKKNMPNEKDRRKDLKILTDQQAILVQGGEVIIIGQGSQIIV